MLLFFLVFFGIQIFILFCCAAAGNDAASQELSDQEQLQFIAGMEKTASEKGRLLKNVLFHCKEDIRIPPRYMLMNKIAS